MPDPISCKAQSKDYATVDVMVTELRIRFASTCEIVLIESEDPPQGLTKSGIPSRQVTPCEAPL